MRRLGLLLIPLLLLGGLASLVWLVLSDPPPAERGPAAQTAALTATPPSRVEEDAPEGPDAPIPEVVSRVVVGTITDLEGTPLPGATVRVVLDGRADRVGQSRGRGRYRVTDVPGRAQRLEVSATGFETYVEEAPRFPAQRQVTVDIELAPKPGYRGQVLTWDQPVQDAYVVLLTEQSDRPLRVGRSDANGRFWLPAADNVARVRAWQGQHGQGEVAAALDTDLVIDLPGGGYLEGFAVNEYGDPVESFTVSATPMTMGAGGPPAQSFDSSTGGFLLGPLAPGTVRLWAAARGHQPVEIRDVEVVAGETRGGIKLVLSSSTILMGRVTDAYTGRAIEGAEIIPAEWRSRALAESVGGWTDGDGNYQLDALPNVRTTVEVKADGYRSLMLGGVEGQPGEKMVRDFALTPQSPGRPKTELTGIGAVLNRHPRGVRIQNVFADGPAEGVLTRGDVVVAVDGRDARQMGLRGVAQAIRGVEGTEVKLQIIRQGRPQIVTLERGRVAMPDRHHPRDDN